MENDPARSLTAIQQKATSDSGANPGILDMLDALERESVVPLSLELAKRYVEACLSAGDYHVYPAGLDARDLLPTLAAMPRIRILGVVDGNAAALGEVQGVPMITPADLAATSHSRVLICHPAREKELSDALRGLGVPEERIVCLYSSAGFLEFCRSREARASLFADIPLGIRTVIVRAGRSGIIIDDDTLARVFPSENTVVLHAGLAVERLASKIFRVIDLHRSLELLRVCLERIQPSTVYLQLNLHSVPIAAMVRRCVPATCLIYEMWDLWRTSIDDLKAEDQAALLGVSDDEAMRARAAELYIMRTADFLISKRGGPLWKRERQAFRPPCAQYFAFVTEDAVAPPSDSFRESGVLRIIFAATLQQPATLAAYDYVRANQDHRPIFEALVAASDVQIDIFNAGHRDSSLDPVFADYIERYRVGPIRYHRRVSAETLRAAMGGYQYGWIRATPATPSVDCLVVIPASLSTCIAVGLPIIIHETIEYAAALVSAFDAGIVVPREKAGADSVAYILSMADPDRHRRGALRLRAHMLEQNRQTMVALSAMADQATGDSRPHTKEA